MPEEFLDNPNIRSMLQHVSGTAVAQTMCVEELARNSRREAALSNDKVDPLSTQGATASIDEHPSGVLLTTQSPTGGSQIVRERSSHPTAKRGHTLLIALSQQSHGSFVKVKIDEIE
jgi:hypothetical protein